MELFKLLGTIAVENNDANKAIDDTTDKARDMESKFGKFMGGVGKVAAVTGKVIGTGLAVGATAMAALTTKALNLSGELEQNMGGSEAVFKDYAGKMQETAKTAFSNMGLSTSNFLGTANKMGALFHGAGFSIQESSKLSASAMQRAADVASIMGISTKDAMESIAGAAKGNFTMMDNLGVAMNDTSIQNYALSKGINKTTAEMTQQEKIGLAMEMFMDKTSYAAGNYAKENETLAGSLGTAKSALTNFLDGSGSVEDVVASFSNATNVIVKNLNELVPKLVNGITQLIQQIVPLLPPLLQSLLPGIIEGAVQLINGVVAAIPMIITALLNALPAIIDGIMQIFNALVAALPKIMQVLCDALPTLIPQIVNALITMLLTLMQFLPQIIQPIINNLPKIITSIVTALMDNLPALIEGCIQLVIGIVQAIPQIILALIEALPTVIESIVTGLWNALPTLLSGIIDMLASIGESIWTMLTGYWSRLGTLFTAQWDNLKTGASETFENIKTSVSEKMAVLQTAMSDIWDKIKTATTEKWDSLKSGISDAVETIKTGVSEKFNAMKETMSTVMQAAKDTVDEKLTNMKVAYDSHGSGIKGTVAAMMEGVKGYYSAGYTFINNLTNGKLDEMVGTISSKLNIAYTTVSSIFNNIKSTIDNIITGAANIVGNAIERIKGFFNFEWSLPHLPMPHPYVSGSFSLKPPSVPSFGIDWYAEGGIMTKPTIFDYNPTTGKAKVGGEAGAEAIAPIDVLQGYVAAAVASQNNGVVQCIEDMFGKLFNILENYFPEFTKQLVLDDGTLVTKLAPKIDKQLGIIYKRKERG